MNVEVFILQVQKAIHYIKNRKNKTKSIAELQKIPKFALPKNEWFKVNGFPHSRK